MHTASSNSGNARLGARTKAIRIQNCHGNTASRPIHSNAGRAPSVRRSLSKSAAVAPIVTMTNSLPPGAAWPVRLSPSHANGASAT